VILFQNYFLYNLYLIKLVIILYKLSWLLQFVLILTKINSIHVLSDLGSILLINLVSLLTLNNKPNFNYLL